MKYQNRITESTVQMTFCFSDFAIRNCLLASDLTVKIGDYGMSEETFKVRDFSKQIFNH